MNAPIRWTPGLQVNLLRCRRIMAENSRTPQRLPVNEFRRAASALIGKGVTEAELNEAQVLSLRLVEQLAQMWCRDSRDVHPESLDWLRRVDGMLQDDPLEVRRWRCVQLVRNWGARWKTTEWQATAETRERLLRQLAYGLAFEAKPVLFGDEQTANGPSPLEWIEPTELASLLDAYDPSPKGKGTPGMMSAERILAELIVLYCDADGALELSVDPDEDSRSAAERIRATLAKAVSRVNKKFNPA